MPIEMQSYEFMKATLEKKSSFRENMNTLNVVMRKDKSFQVRRTMNVLPIIRLKSV